MSKEFSPKIAEAIENFLKEDDWKFAFDSDRGFFKFGVNLQSKLKSVNYIVDVKETAYVVYAISPIGATPDNRDEMLAMADFICRANYGLRNGNFELDMNDGEIRYKCFVNCEDIELSKSVIEESIYCPPLMFERYAQGIIGIVFANMDPKEAAELCESE